MCKMSHGAYDAACDLIQSASSQVIGNDDVGNGVKHELNIVRVRRTRHVTVDLFSGRFVLGLKLRLDVSSGFSVFLSSYGEKKNNGYKTYMFKKIRNNYFKFQTQLYNVPIQREYIVH